MYKTMTTERIAELTAKVISKLIEKSVKGEIGGIVYLVKLYETDQLEVFLAVTDLTTRTYPSFFISVDANADVIAFPCEANYESVQDAVNNLPVYLLRNIHSNDVADISPFTQKQGVALSNQQEAGENWTPYDMKNWVEAQAGLRDLVNCEQPQEVVYNPFGVTPTSQYHIACKQDSKKVTD